MLGVSWSNGSERSAFSLQLSTRSLTVAPQNGAATRVRGARNQARKVSGRFAISTFSAVSTQPERKRLLAESR